MKKTTTYFVAREKDEEIYACEGRETGMGRAIEGTTLIDHAYKAGSPGGLARWMGGHYRRYIPVKVTDKIERTLEDATFPPEEELFPDY